MPVPPQLIQCVRKQLPLAARIRFKKSSRCFQSFADYLGKNMELADKCRKSHPLFRPPAAIDVKQRPILERVVNSVLALMKTSGYRKGSKKWIELASLALFWAVEGNASSGLDQPMALTRSKLLANHFKQYPQLKTWFKKLTAANVSLKVGDWGGKAYGPTYTLGDALSKQSGACSERTNAYIRIWRRLMKRAGVTSTKARVVMMSYSLQYGVIPSGHAFMRVYIGNNSIDLDLTFNRYDDGVKRYGKKVPWHKARPTAEWIRWAIHMFNLGTPQPKIFVRYWEKYGHFFKGFDAYSMLEYTYYYKAGIVALKAGKLVRARSFHIEARDYPPLKRDFHRQHVRSMIALSYFWDGKHEEAKRALKRNQKDLKTHFLMDLQYSIVKYILSGSKTLRRPCADSWLRASGGGLAFQLLPNLKVLYSQPRFRRTAEHVIRYATNFMPISKAIAKRVRHLIRKRSYRSARLLVQRNLTGKGKRSIRGINEFNKVVGLLIKVKEKAEPKTTNVARRAITDHTLSLRFSGAHSLDASIRARYKLSFPVYLSGHVFGIRPFLSLDVGFNSHLNGVIAAQGGIDMFITPIPRNRISLSLSGGGVAQLGKNESRIDPLGRFSISYRRMFGKPTFEDTDRSSRIGHGIVTEVGISFDNKFKDAFATIGYELRF